MSDRETVPNNPMFKHIRVSQGEIASAFAFPRKGVAG